MGTNSRISLHRQEKLIETLLKFRLRKYKFDFIEVEVYNRFEGDKSMCRLEVFKGGNGIADRILKYEAEIDGNYVSEAEYRIKKAHTRI